ncbi:MAG: endonuclease/exonuclease/phosphatase family protein [Bacteroidetes bacterium]|nr:endonuclease/exonuclease/phosphatase family protein [Bacteroidota bacterium]
MAPSKKPAAFAKELSGLRADLTKTIPAKRSGKNLLIATWNLKAFGDLNEAYANSTAHQPKRDMAALECIAEIVSRFDVVAIQEVKDNLKCLRHLMKLLGPHWAFVMTDTNKGRLGNGERLAFVFDKRRVDISGLACEIVIPAEALSSKRYTLNKQFARTPYAVSFKAGGSTFVLLTLHVYYQAKASGRVNELLSIARWAKDWAGDLKSWNHSLLVLGDFNIERQNDAAWQAFTSTGLYTPPELQKPPRSLVDGKPKFYDQISWFKTTRQDKISLRFNTGGDYNFKGKVLQSRNYTTEQLQWRISDHLPLWAEFNLS